jgi:hypothetical protein
LVLNRNFDGPQSQSHFGKETSFLIEPRLFVFAAKSLSITVKAEGACSSFISETTRWQNSRDRHLTNVDFLIARKFSDVLRRRSNGKTEATVVQELYFKH